MHSRLHYKDIYYSTDSVIQFKSRSTARYRRKRCLLNCYHAVTGGRTDVKQSDTLNNANTCINYQFSIIWKPGSIHSMLPFSIQTSSIPFYRRIHLKYRNVHCILCHVIVRYASDSPTSEPYPLDDCKLHGRLPVIQQSVT